MNWNEIYSKGSHQKYYFCDVGARGGLEEPWKKHSPNLTAIAFEPDNEEFLQLKKSPQLSKVFNSGLYKDNEAQKLYLLNSRGCSSFLLPNEKFLNLFPNYQRFNVEQEVEIQCDTLDNILANDSSINIDFIKIDTQGTELDILRGGKEGLQECCGIQVEVEFQELYRNQCLFADVDTFIRNELGLQLQDLKKTYWKYKTRKMSANNTKGRLVFGDALYFRCPSSIDTWIESLDEKRRRQKLLNVIFTGYIYGYPDYCFKILESSIAKKYLEPSALKLVTSIIEKNNQSIWSFFSPIWKSRIGHRLRIISSLFRPTHEGWASQGETLGARKKLGGYIS